VLVKASRVVALDQVAERLLGGADQAPPGPFPEPDERGS
jgi:hypothetical protein